MEPLTLRWVRVELTIALDLYSRCIAGLRLSPVSTKAVDAAAVLYEAMRPPPTPRAARRAGGQPRPRRPLALPGGARVVLVDADLSLTRTAGPAAVRRAETIVVDHGKIYLSEHLMQRVRPPRHLDPAGPALHTRPTRPPVERFFRTLREGLLQALPGYKGPDVYSRGETSRTRRSTSSTSWSRSSASGWALLSPQAARGAGRSRRCRAWTSAPQEMFEHGVARAGFLRVPARPTWSMTSCRWSGARSSTTASRSTGSATTERR